MLQVLLRVNVDELQKRFISRPLNILIDLNGVNITLLLEVFPLPMDASEFWQLLDAIMRVSNDNRIASPLWSHATRLIE